MLNKYKFAYPDIPYLIDRELYDYFFSLDQVIRLQGNAIQELIQKVYGND